MTMSFRLILPLAALVAVLAAVPAQAAYRVGVSEQQAKMFSDTRWKNLKLKRVRYIVPWDWDREGWQVGEVDGYMNAARANGQEVLVSFNAPRGCWQEGDYSSAERCKAPSAKEFAASFRRFDDRFPWVQVYSPWNEMNHPSQPTYRKPKKAAKYYNKLRKERSARDFKLMGADLLDISNMIRYVRKFNRAARGTPRLTGLHNYQDVNYKTTRDTIRLLDTVPGEVWLTETGGLVKFGRLEYNEKRAKKRARYLFRFTARYDSRRAGLRSRISRVYYYKWYGEAKGSRFDAGLVSVDGTKKRKAFKTFKKYAKAHR
jgi:hypothetical protein